MRKPTKTPKPAPVSHIVPTQTLQSITGGINGGLNRDIIRRRY